MSVLSEVLAANKVYREAFGEKGELALPPARHFAILTCMDARLDPAKYAGLTEGDAHVIRNAADARVTTQFVPSSSPTSSSGRGSGSSSITPIAAWSSSPIQ